MITTFTWSPGYAPELTQAPRVLTAQFGDGYAQRVGDGINNDPETWSLSFPNVSDAIAEAIIAFLRAAGGAQPFYWTPPRAGDSITVICRAWRRQVTSRNANTISVTFEQVAALGLTDWDDGATIWDNGATIWD